MTKGMKLVATTDKHEGFRQELIDVFRRRQDTVPSDQMLAIASHFVGQLIALQDQRKVTPQEAMQIVTENLAEGNRSIVQQLLDKTGGTA